MGGLARAFSFDGTAKRTAFLRFVPIGLAIWLVAAWLDETFIAPNLCLINENWTCYLPGEVREGITLDMIVAAILMLPLFSVMARRMHSHNRSGWWSLLALPFLCAVFLLQYDFGVVVPMPVLAATFIAILPLLFWMLTKGPGKQPGITD